MSFPYLLSKFHAYIFIGLGEKLISNCQMKYSVSTTASGTGEKGRNPIFDPSLIQPYFFIFFISPRFIILFTLFYHFPVILLGISFCHSERPRGARSRYQESNALTAEATSHSTISMRGQRETGKIQKNNYHHE